MPAITRSRHNQAQPSPSTTRHCQTTTARQSVPGSGTRLARFRQAARQRQSQPSRRSQALADDSRQELLELIRGEFRALTESHHPIEDTPGSTSSDVTPASTTVSVAQSSMSTTPTTSRTIVSGQPNQVC